MTPDLLRAEVMHLRGRTRELEALRERRWSGAKTGPGTSGTGWREYIDPEGTFCVVPMAEEGQDTMVCIPVGVEDGTVLLVIEADYDGRMGVGSAWISPAELRRLADVAEEKVGRCVGGHGAVKNLPIPDDQLDALREQGLSDVEFAAVPLPVVTELFDLLQDVAGGLCSSGLGCTGDNHVPACIRGRAELAREALDDSDFGTQAEALARLLRRPR